MPDVDMAEFHMGRQRRVILACEKWWPLTGSNPLPNSADCSGFVKSVAREIGVTLTGDANMIYNAIQHSPWSRLESPDDAAQLAALAASNGMFVVGAWKNPDPRQYGQVAVIVDTNCSSRSPGFRKRALASGRQIGLESRAMAYWGRIGPEGHEAQGQDKGDPMHSESWSSAERPTVIYAACTISAP